MESIKNITKSKKVLSIYWQWVQTIFIEKRIELQLQFTLNWRFLFLLWIFTKLLFRGNIGFNLQKKIIELFAVVPCVDRLFSIFYQTCPSIFLWILNFPIFSRNFNQLRYPAVPCSDNDHFLMNKSLEDVSSYKVSKNSEANRLKFSDIIR